MPAKTNPVITVWDHKAHLDLLQAVLAVARPDTDEWNMIIASVQQKGYRYSASAAQQHLARLKKRETMTGAASLPSANNGESSSAAATAGATAFGAPREPRASGGDAKTPGCNNARKRKARPTVEDDDFEPEVGRATIKKQRRGNKGHDEQPGLTGAVGTH